MWCSRGCLGPHTIALRRSATRASWVARGAADAPQRTYRNVWPGPQAAVTATAIGFTDPVLDGPALALHRPGGPGEVRTPDGTRALPGTHPAVGGGRVAWIDPQGITVSGATTIPAPGADAIAVSAAYVAWRAGQTLNAASLDPATQYAARPVIAGNVGRPALSGSLMVIEVDGRIEPIDLTTGSHTLLRRQARAELRGPSIYGA